MFKSLKLILITIFSVLMLHQVALALTPKHYDQLEFPPLPEIQLPKYERYQLDNKMVVYLIEDHRLPLVTGNLLIRTGDRLEPPNQVGLAQLVGMVLRSGGTKQHSPDELNQLLEQKAAFVETGIGTTSGFASFSTLSFDLDSVFNLFTEVIREPAFDDQFIELGKTQLRGEIARRNDNPKDIASREFGKLIYGKNSPYGRTIEYENLDNIKREDLINFYQTYFHPNQMILGIEGDFEPEQMKVLIEEAFGDWQASNTENIVIPSVTEQYEPGIFLVDQPQLTQSNILLGHLGGKLDDPDYPALDVLNGVLNGFGGRLFNELRSRLGLAYTVYGYWNANYDYLGLFVAGGQTRSTATVDFVRSLNSEIEQIRNKPITPKELAYAKESILNSFVFNFQKPEQTLSRLMGYEYFGYPKDFIFQYQLAVKATTIEDIQRVAQKYLQPEKMVILVVGNAEKFQTSLSSLGKEVQKVDITISKPK